MRRSWLGIFLSISPVVVACGGGGNNGAADAGDTLEAPGSGTAVVPDAADETPEVVPLAVPDRLTFCRHHSRHSTGNSGEGHWRFSIEASAVWRHQEPGQHLLLLEFAPAGGRVSVSTKSGKTVVMPAASERRSGFLDWPFHADPIVLSPEAAESLRIATRLTFP